MALLDLSNVTRALVRLVQEGVRLSSAWDGTLPTVSALPPDRVASATGNVLSLYLYHVVEDTRSSNLPPTGSGVSPIAQTPMGLVLHYQLTAHTSADLGAEEGLFEVQLLFGLAMKVLHDHASITDDTRIAGVDLLREFGLDDRQNRFRLVLRPVPAEDAVSYWTAGQGPMRLASYYEVSVVFLEPEPPPRGALPVLEPSVTIFTSGAPHVLASENRLELAPPGGATRTIAMRPAQVPIGERFVLHGTDLVGDGTDLVLESPDWEEEQVVDAVAWGLLARPTEVSATVGAFAGGETVVPGVYAVAVRVARTVEAGAETRTIAQLSNRTAVIVTPDFDPPAPVAAGSLLTLTGTLFRHDRIPTDADDARSVQVLLGSDVLALDTSGGVDPGRFRVVDESTIELRIPATLEPGPHAVRIRVRGAESPPRWVEVLP